MKKLTLALSAVLIFGACSEGTVDPVPVQAPTVAAQSDVPDGINPRNLAALGGLFSTSSSGPTAIVDNGVVQLGINQEGHLNVGGGTPSTGTASTTAVGLRYIPTGSEATAPGCLCEGWGVADAGTGQQGWATVANASPGVGGLSLVSFTSDATSAVSVVNAFGRLLVTHDFHPSAATPNLYEVVVTIKNVSPDAVSDLRYTRNMDWDIAPNTFNEYSTVGGTAAATNVLYASNNGFNDVRPLASRWDLYPSYTGDFTDGGPTDQGAHFDFGFDELAAGETLTFRIFYGAAGNEAQAEAALGAVAAEVYSFGQANYNGVWTPAPGVGAGYGTHGATTGEPHTFIFGFSGVGGDPVFPPAVTATVTGTEGNDDWYTSDILITWNIDLQGEEIISSEGCDPTTVDYDTAGETFTCTVTTTGGTSQGSVTVKRDATPPVVTYSGNAGTYDISATIAITCSAADAMSGWASDTCEDIAGPAYDFLGVNTYSAAATDNAGNEGSGETSFTVVASYAGLCTLVHAWVEHPGVANSLCVKLEAAARAEERGDLNARNGSLGAFINEVAAQAGKKVPADKAPLLTALANLLMS